MNKLVVLPWVLPSPPLLPISLWNPLNLKPFISYPLKPNVWKKYVDDTNVIWPHSKEELDKFVLYLTTIRTHSLHYEIEENANIPFLDVRT